MVCCHRPKRDSIVVVALMAACCANAASKTSRGPSCSKSSSGGCNITSGISKSEVVGDEMEDGDGSSKECDAAIAVVVKECRGIFVKGEVSEVV